jgi:hypothetical protein
MMEAGGRGAEAFRRGFGSRSGEELLDVVEHAVVAFPEREVIVTRQFDVPRAGDGGEVLKSRRPRRPCKDVPWNLESKVPRRSAGAMVRSVPGPVVGASGTKGWHL